MDQNEETSSPGAMTAISPAKPAAGNGFRLRDLWRDLRDAVRGTNMDYTKGSIGRAILLLSVPMMLEMVMESAFAVVDVYFVSSLGASAIATVGLTESVLTLMYAVAIGLSMGTTALVARRIGEKKPGEAADAAVQAIIISLAACIPFAVAGIFFAKDILALMGADAWAIEHGYRYTAWMLGGNAVIMLIFVINAVFRGAGDAAIAMRVLWLSNAINIVLDPILIWLGANSQNGHRRGGHCHKHRARHRCARATLGAVPRGETYSRAGDASAVARGSDGAARAHVAGWHRAVHYCDIVLDRAGADRVGVRQ
jgi:hypothetical protein